MRSIAEGTVLGDYRIERELRSTSGGTLYRAEQSSVMRPVILLVTPDTAFLERARVATAVEHPHLLPVYDWGESDGVQFAALRETRGETLAERVRIDGPLPTEQALEVVAQVAGALDALRAAGVAPIAPSAHDVELSQRGTHLHAYLSPLGAVATSAESVAALADLVDRAVGGTSRGGTRELRLVVERARSGEFSTAGEFSAAATGTLLRPSRPLIRAGALVAIVALVVVAATQSGENDPPGPPRLATVARIDAAVRVDRLVALPPVQAAGRVWVLAGDSELVAIDAKSNTVTGVAVRVPPAPQGGFLLGTNSDFLLAIDNRGVVHRVDGRSRRVLGTRRVLRRRQIIDGFFHEGSVWLTAISPEAENPVHELVEVDAATLRTVGSPIRLPAIGPGLQVDADAAWVTNFDGSVNRIDLATRDIRSRRIFVGPWEPVLAHGRLWVLDQSGWVAAVDAERLEHLAPSAEVGFPQGAAATEDALWIVAGPDNNPEGRSTLRRLEPRTSRETGRALPLGARVSPPLIVDGALWLADPSKQRVIKVRPSAAPGARTAPSLAPAERKSLPNGPLAPRSWRAARFALPFSLDIDDRGWLSFDPTSDAVELRRGGLEGPGLSFSIPTQLFAASGAVVAVGGPEQVVRHWRRHPHLITGPPQRITFGGVPAFSIPLRARGNAPPVEGCPGCVPLSGWAKYTAFADTRPSRQVVLRHRGRTVVVAVDGSDGARLAPTVRFE